MHLKGEIENVTICGNICESGDLLAEDYPLPHCDPGDILAILDAGAYGYSMASNYNQRLRPAEVLLTNDKKIKLIRRRDTIKALSASGKRGALFTGRKF
jgi:diaminopimelate decarboxylase